MTTDPNQPQWPYQPMPAQTPPSAQKRGGAGKVIGLIVAFVLTFVVGIAIGAAASSDKGTPQAGASAPAGTNRPQSDTPTATEAATTKAAPASSTPSKSKNPKFGETYTWKDGIAVTVGAPQPYEKSNQYVDQPGGTSGVVMAVTIVNTGTANFDPTFFISKMQSGNKEAEKIYDSEVGLGSSPSTVLLPGRETVFNLGYWAVNPADLVLQVAPGFSYDPAIYTS